MRRQLADLEAQVARLRASTSSESSRSGGGLMNASEGDRQTAGGLKLKDAVEQQGRDLRWLEQHVHQSQQEALLALVDSQQRLAEQLAELQRSQKK
jgi:hypothetical protein